MTTRHKRFNLLLDEMLPRREKYPQVNNYHNVRHIVHDLKNEGATDTDVVKLAKDESRIVITKNIKHLKELGKKYKVDIFGVTETLPPEELDKKLMAVLKRRKYVKMKGRFTKITA